MPNFFFLPCYCITAAMLAVPAHGSDKKSEQANRKPVFETILPSEYIYPSPIYSRPIGRRIIAAENPIATDDIKLYKISINPFFLQIYSRRAKELGYSIDRNESSPEPIQPGMQLFAKEISEKYSLKINSINSWIESSISAYMPHELASTILEEYFVSEISEISENSDVLSGYTNTPYGTDLLPWYTQSVASNSVGITTTNPFYMIDMPLRVSDLPDDINLVTVQDYRARPAYDWNYHSGFITQFVGGKINGQRSIGINPGQPIRIFSYITGVDTILTTAMNNAASFAENNDEFAVLNFSSNSPPNKPFSENNYNEHKDKAKLLRK